MPQLRQCTDLASRRGSRSININDLIFQIRHDTAKVSRLRTFLSWKDVRKNVKDSDDKGGDADLGAGEDPVGGVVAGGPVDDTTKKNKKAKVGLPWEPSSFFSQEVPERDDEEDEEEEEMNFITLQRLRKADERTKAMTREEYVTWSEYRQASFTYRKGKRFREWAGFGIVTDSKPSDDIVDILGFLTFEMVQTLTENALKVKEQEEALKALSGGGAGDGEGASKKRKLQQGLFDPPSEGKTPIEPRHVQEAFRRLQARGKKSRAMLIGTRLPQHTPLTIVSCVGLMVLEAGANSDTVLSPFTFIVGDSTKDTRVWLFIRVGGRYPLILLFYRNGAAFGGYMCADLARCRWSTCDGVYHTRAWTRRPTSFHKTRVEVLWRSCARLPWAGIGSFCYCLAFS